MGEHQIQRGVVFHQRMVLVVPNELHHRREGERVREAVLAVTVVNLDELVVPVFPVYRTTPSIRLFVYCKT